uniref:Uncharacterized protein n=1 Tax=Alexandrium catenella TaxID=2925 RepID=A0A7S1WI88_ALECA|mmetsp:Transcript_63053/g.168413  ORF Transcript_63053/g.168413 Transcript_63053/m.168413 type:complete len:323 (+) Transcript_63053:121-1089(+)
MAFNVPMATIFARELMEAGIIIGQYRTLVQRSDEWDEERKAQALKRMWFCAGCAAGLAIVVNVLVAIPLGILGNKLDKTAAEIIEGVSKVVAAVCILQLSLKVPKWLNVGPYARLAADTSMGSTEKELFFNVAWNIWREIAEIGIFLIPFFLSRELEALPLSALAGIAVGIGLGGLIFLVLQVTRRRMALVVMMSVITGWLSCGLFTGGMHEFEEVLGETPDVFWMPGCKSSSADSCSFWNHGKFPCALIKPFGYSHSPSVLQLACFWSFVAVALLMHGIMYHLAVRKAVPAAEVPVAGGKAASVGQNGEEGEEPKQEATAA